MTDNIVWISNLTGYCIDINNVYESISSFQADNQISFVCSEVDKDFGHIDVLAKKRTVLWSSEECFEMEDVELPFDGIPFFILGKAIYKCEEEKKRPRKRKAKANSNFPALIPKLCPAKIMIFEVVKFPNHKIEFCNQELKDDMIEKLSADLSVGKALAERRFYIYFPKKNNHQSHIVSSDASSTSSKLLSEDATSLLHHEKNITLNSLATCDDLLEKIKERTYLCDEATLAYGHIILKDALQRLVTVKEHGLFNWSTTT